MKVKVVINNPENLRILFPEIVFSDGYRVVSGIVYSDLDYPVPDNVLFILQDKSGFPIETSTGLQRFLETVGYFSNRKYLTCFEKLDDSMTVEELFKTVAMFRVFSKVRKKDSEIQWSVPELLSLPLYERLNKSLEIGAKRVLSRIIKDLSRFYSRDTGMSQMYYRDLSKVLVGFNTREAKKFSLSGDWEADCSLFLTYFI